jgi:hypothetical protein
MTSRHLQERMKPEIKTSRPLRAKMIKDKLGNICSV